MEEWLVALFVIFIITFKWETKYQHRLKAIYKNFVSNNDQKYQGKVKDLQWRQKELSELQESLEAKLSGGRKKVCVILKELEEKNESVNKINLRLRNEKMELIEMKSNVEKENFRYNTINLEDSIKKCLYEKNQLADKIASLEAGVVERSETNNKLRIDYDKAVFKILQTKAKKVAILEKLKESENENDRLNELIKQDYLLLKKIKTSIAPLENSVRDFRCTWNPVLSKMRIEADNLEKVVVDSLAIFQSKNLNSVPSDDWKFVQDKFNGHYNSIIAEINSRKKSYDLICEDIICSYNVLMKDLFENISHIISTEDLPESLAHSNPNSADLAKILKTNLFANLNIRHLGSLVYDSSFLPNSSDSYNSRNSLETSAHTDDTSFSQDADSQDSSSEIIPAGDFSSEEPPTFFNVENIEPLDSGLWQDEPMLGFR